MRNQHPLDLGYRPGRRRNDLYLDYTQIRRRIERRLGGMRAIGIHLGLFLLATLLMLLFTRMIPGRFVSPYITDPVLGGIMTVWSAVLQFHGLVAYARSGASSQMRDRAIDRELRERLDADDTELLADHRRVFRLRGILEEDVRKRAGVMTALNAFLILNTVNWIIWWFQGSDTSFTWQMTIPIALAFLLPAMLINAIRRALREQDTNALLAEWAEGRYSGEPKRKHTLEDLDEQALYLSDDGELVEYEVDRQDDLTGAQKPKSAYGSE